MEKQWIIRILISVFVLTFISIAITFNYLGNFGKQSWYDYIVDADFNVPLEYRIPRLTIREYIQNRENIQQEQMVDSRMMFPKQPFEGSLLLGGYHSLLAPNAKWLNHEIVLKCEEEIAKIAQL